MWPQTHSLALLLGRILLSIIFLLSGAMKVMRWHETSALMESEGMPAVPIFLALSVLIEIGGGMLILFGYKTSWAALVLAAFLVPVTLTIHHFWTYQGEAMASQMTNFLKNLAIIGGLLSLAAAGAGRFAMDQYGTNMLRDGRRSSQEPTGAPITSPRMG